MEKGLPLREESRGAGRRLTVLNRRTVTLRGERVNAERAVPDSPPDSPEDGHPACTMAKGTIMRGNGKERNHEKHCNWII